MGMSLPQFGLAQRTLFPAQESGALSFAPQRGQSTGIGMTRPSW
jgi:hypothetical protein